ncbi:hypothetical protein LTR56_015982 [Elasticomyces elasticus]|nr:hypothetical protein LTR22_021243 [Elasticomyces elasticus]KAK3633068.1 hypothetical protein LTR56_015982 [Elasticomyces elasticus]KAK4917940.1 hypothetical protein LTR49_014215 [Elasticomyces elasticus]KAK5753337.1 hypothetical protein LTS12_016580 [Elasticomyces elasticus]
MPGSKKRKGPIKVLAARRRMSKGIREIYNKNATASPLLSLPPEIRTRIWRSLLSGHTIHIDASAIDKVQHHVCKNTISDYELAQNLKADKDTIRFQTYQDHHAGCKPTNHNDNEGKAESRLHLNVLRACRQIHQEAAILPYAENVFAFASNDDLDFFLDTIIVEQARALQRLVVTRLGQKCTNYDPPICPKYLESKLQSLEELTAFFEFTGGISARDFTSEAYKRFDLARHLMVFEDVVIKKVTVAAYNVEAEFGLGLRHDVPREMLENWVKSIEGGNATQDGT